MNLGTNQVGCWQRPSRTPQHNPICQVSKHRRVKWRIRHRRLHRLSENIMRVFTSWTGISPHRGVEINERAKEYLHNSEMPRLTEEVARELDVPISIEEFKKVINLLKVGKAPGPDGYTLLYYKLFAEKLAPRFTAAFNSLREGRRIPRETLMAHIAVIPKEGKDPSQCSSYRPIALLNVDLKIFSKILALRLEEHIPALIHPDQVGFTAGREGKYAESNKCNIYCTEQTGTPYIVLSGRRKSFR